MPRFPIASREQVPQDQVAAFDSIVSARDGVVPEVGSAYGSHGGVREDRSHDQTGILAFPHVLGP